MNSPRASYEAHFICLLSRHNDGQPKFSPAVRASKEPATIKQRAPTRPVLKATAAKEELEASLPRRAPPARAPAGQQQQRSARRSKSSSKQTATKVFKVSESSSSVLSRAGGSVATKASERVLVAPSQSSSSKREATLPDKSYITPVSTAETDSKSLSLKRQKTPPIYQSEIEGSKVLSLRPYVTSAELIKQLQQSTQVNQLSAKAQLISSTSVSDSARGQPEEAANKTGQEMVSTPPQARQHNPSTPPTTLKTSLLAIPAAKKLQQARGKLVLTAKEADSSPSVSQTPAAGIGNSSGSNAAQKAQAPNNQQRLAPRVSMTKTVAQQMPNFKTLAPGFGVKSSTAKGILLAKGASSSSSSSSSDKREEKSVSMTSVPSDYEHIYHAPSQLEYSTTNVGKRLNRLRKEKKKRTRQKEAPPPAGPPK